ncbi:uncharacterized protein LOC111117986 [Crassostrea virginica]
MTSERGKKRPRSDDCEDCNPISKRINRLQIESASNPSCTELAQTMGVCIPKAPPNKPEDMHLQCSHLQIQSNSHDANQQMESSNLPSTSINNNLNAENPTCMACNMGQGDPYYQELMQGYDPELNEEDNPHYFSINRLLFEAHASRTGRHKTDFSNS